jgi:tRNA(fMet)-specific endonuclease VapC
MPEYMLDTDITSYIMKGSNRAVLRRLSTVPTGAVCISAITQSELEFGVETSPRPEKDRDALQLFLRHVVALDYPVGAAAIYGRIRANLKSRRALIGPNDTLIAAHALFLGLTLVTNNTREFGRVPDLKIENWA